MAAEAGCAAAATAAGVAAGSFGYNRANYMYDAEMRFERFCSGREYANQQAEQYREDLRTLAALTVKKNSLWATTTTLCMALCVALYCAGRLGLHGPSPPMWIMGLWLTNNAAAFAFMALGTFLAMHAAFRAQAASVHLLTRKTRVPVPSMKQLDEARQFGSEFEQQNWGDIFRVPYMTNNGAPKTDSANYSESASPTSRKGRSTSAPPTRSKASSWIKTEFETDRRGTVEPSGLPADAAPEHFQLYSAAQKEFYQHDIYARVCVFLGFIHYFQSLCFYGLGHINIELRAFWVAYACVFVIAVLMALVLRFDIIPATSSRKHYLPYCEYFGPLAVLPAAIGMSLDFRVQFDPAVIGLTWVIIIIAYLMQLVYSLRILEVVLPDEKFAGLGERLGAAWLPESFNKVPSSFYHVLYFVAPPTKLQPGQNDLLREVKEGGAGAFKDVVGDEVPSKLTQKDTEESSKMQAALPAFVEEEQVNPWKLVSAIAGVLPLMWVFLIFGCFVDIALGEQALVTAPHWSRPPMTRISKKPHELATPLGFPWPAGAKPWLPEQMAWHEEKRHADEYSFNRRLSAADTLGSSFASTAAVASASQPTRTVSELSAALKGLMDTLPGEKSPMAPTTLYSTVWPAFFEPRLLVCGADGQAAALTSRGMGASVQLKEEQYVAVAEAFHLGGLSYDSPLVGASWGNVVLGKEGLLVVNRRGDIMACDGARPKAGGTWSCASAASQGLPAALPVAEGARIASAAIFSSPNSKEVRAAITLEGDSSRASLFSFDGEEWYPVGDIRIPGQQIDSKIALSFNAAGELLVATGTQLVRRSFEDGSILATVQHKLSSAGAWQAACAGAKDQVIHLRLDSLVGTTGLEPQIITSVDPQDVLLQ